MTNISVFLSHYSEDKPAVVVLSGPQVIFAEAGETVGVCES